MPDELLPFFESPSLATLANVLRADPLLYLHPLVVLQLGYLVGRAHVEREVHPEGRPPALGELGNLIEAHVAGLSLGWRVKWERKIQRPGPKGRIKNPHVANLHRREWINAEDLDSDFRALQNFFSARNQQLRPLPEDGDTRHTIARITKLTMEAVQLPGVAVWTGWKMYDGATYLAGYPDYIAEFRKRLNDWRLTSLADHVHKMLGRDISARFKKEGSPTYMACVVLAWLLAETPEKIWQTIDNYRYPRHRKHPNPRNSTR